MRSKKTFTIAISGIFLALSLVFLYLASFIPGLEMTMYGISGIFVVIIIEETGVKTGILFFVATVLMGLLLIPNKLAILPYVFFFGLYGVLKYFAEKPKKIWVQIILKLGIYSIVFVIAYNFFKELFFGDSRLEGLPFYLLALIGAVIFLVYDYILTLLLRIYHERIKRDKINIKVGKS